MRFSATFFIQSSARESVGKRSSLNHAGRVVSDTAEISTVFSYIDKNRRKESINHLPKAISYGTRYAAIVK